MALYDFAEILEQRYINLVVPTQILDKPLRFWILKSWQWLHMVYGQI